MGLLDETPGCMSHIVAILLFFFGDGRTPELDLRAFVSPNAVNTTRVDNLLASDAQIHGYEASADVGVQVLRTGRLSPVA